MPTDNRQFMGSISIRLGTQRVKLELAPAEQHGGAAGLFRVRVGRRWHDHADGGPLFFDRAGLAELAAAVAFDALPELPQAPDLPRNSRVTVKFWHNDMPRSESTWTSTPPFPGRDGRFYVGVMTYAAGFVFVPINDVTVRHRHD